MGNNGTELKVGEQNKNLLTLKENYRSKRPIIISSIISNRVDGILFNY